MRYRLASAVAGLLLAGSGLAAASRSVAALGTGAMSGLHVSGSTILNGANQPVQMRGVNRSSLEYGCLTSYWADGPLGTQGEVDAMKAWNINSVRVVLNEDCWLGLHGVPASYAGANYQNFVATYVNLLTSNDLSVIINLHWNGDGTSVATEQEPMADRAYSNAFWTSVANTFKTNSAVMFEPYNEPHDITWACWRDGGCSVQGSQRGEGSFVAAGMQEMVNAIRATGATNIIVVTGLNWGSDLSQWPQYRPTDALGQLVAGWHSYGDGLSCQDATCWNSTLATVLNSAPILATEIGEFDCGHSYIDQVTTWLDTHNRQGYYAWSWGAFSCARDPALLADWNGTPTQTYGSGYRAHLLQLGTPSPMPTSTPTVPGTSTPTPTPAPTSASTATPTGLPVSPTSTSTQAPTVTRTVTPVRTPTPTATPCWPPGHCKP